MSAALQARFDAAVAIAGQAAALAMRLRPPPGAPQAALKGPQDWVTEADTATERVISDSLLSAFPSDGFQGEEGGVARAGTLRWVVDPIDGTANYARGGARWCVSIACMEGNVPLIGVLAAPAVQEVLTAARGRGAHLNGRPARAAVTAQADRAVMEVGWSRRRPRADFMALCDAVLAGGSSLRFGGSGALGLADVATGRIDGFAELHINLWDVAAALVIVHEAGGAVSDFMAGGDGSAGNQVLACAPGMAQAWSALPGLPPAAWPSGAG